MYKHILKPILFRFQPERAHKIIFQALGIFGKIPFFRSIIRLIYKKESPTLHRTLWGIDFPNPVGVAGGLDKNCERYNELSDFGFGFVEVGSITPLPQDGNPTPRVFRVPQDRALINRMGIPNKGVLNAIAEFKKNRPEVIIAANIAKNTVTQENDTAKDYEKTFSLLYDFVDMFVVNISCPNVVGLTNLQDVSYLSDILDGILDKRMGMDVCKPVLIKLSPDLVHEQINEVLEYAMRSGIDGIVAGNTSRGRDGLTIDKAKIDAIGNGGLSGAPIYAKSLAMVKYIHEYTKGRMPIVGCGGIMSPEQAKEMLAAGASLIEIYSGFIYEGPGLVKRILRAIDNN